MTDEIKLGHCVKCSRLEPESALHKGYCIYCIRDCKHDTHSFMAIVGLSIASAIATLGFLACLIWG